MYLVLAIAGAALAFTTTIFSIFTDAESPAKARQRIGLLILGAAALVIAIASDLAKSRSEAAAEHAHVLEVSSTAKALAGQSEALQVATKKLDDERVLVVAQHAELVCLLTKTQGAAACRSLDRREQSQVVGAVEELNRQPRPAQFDVDLQYFQKDLDPQRITASLAKAGFNRVRPMTASAVMAQYPTDSIFFGPRVPSEAVRGAALTMMSAGVSLYQVKCKSTLGKLLQIGAEADLRRDVALTPASLDAAIAKARC